jgi:uncharacterized membrane protein YbhN (UPF0104 family)
MQLRKTAAWVFGTATFAACVWYLYSRFNWGASMSVFLSADPRWLVGGGGLSYFAYLIARSLRWQIMIRSKGSKSRFLAAYYVTTITQGLAVVSPGQLGEVLKIELTKRHSDLGRWPGAGAFVAERIIDMIVLGAIALIGLVAYGPVVDTGSWVSAFGFISAAGLCVVAIILTSRHSLVGTGLCAKLREALPAPRIMVKASVLSLISWVMVALGWRAALMSVGIGLTIAQSAWLVAVVVIAQLASLIPGGVGAAEVVAIELLHLWGHDLDRALAGAIALRALGMLIIGNAILHWVWWTLFGSKLWSATPARQHG